MGFRFKREYVAHCVEQRARVLFLGEDNPHGSDPRHALFPAPLNSAGWRLLRITGLRRLNYLRHPIYRKNLCEGKWSTPEAREAAQGVVDDYQWSVVVALGAKVRRACGHPELAFFESVELSPGRTLLALPHPSGRNRAWNAPDAVPRALAKLRELAPHVPWGGAA